MKQVTVIGMGAAGISMAKEVAKTADKGTGIVLVPKFTEQKEKLAYELKTYQKDALELLKPVLSNNVLKF